MRYSLTNILFIFAILFGISALTPLTDSEAFSKIAALLEFLLLFWSLYKVYFGFKPTISEIRFGLIFLVLLVFHFLLNPHSEIETFIKILCPIIFFMAGNKLKEDNIIMSKNQKRITIFLVCALPVLIRLMQVAIQYPSTKYYSLFVNSNNFSYYFIVSTLILYLLYPTKKYYIYFILIGFGLSRTIGALLAFVLAIALYNRRNLLKPKFLIAGGLGAVLLYVLLFHSNIEIFTRIKGSFSTFVSLSKGGTNFSKLADVEYGDAIGHTSTGKSDLSFLFRIKNWSEIWGSLSKSSLLYILFGHGLMSVPLITSTGLVAHNDYLGILYELGLLLSLLLFISYLRILKNIDFGILNIIFFCIAIYHFTENLYYNVLVTSIHFFLLGVLYQKTRKHEDSTNKQISLH